MQNTRLKTLFLILCFALIGIAFTRYPVKPKVATVYVFLSETCPICQSYTVSLNELYKKYHPKGINFIGVFPNYDANADSVAVFKKKYSIPFGLVLDRKAALTSHFNATITPEVFVESSEKQLLYSGRIDDRFYSLGKRRNVVSSNDLDYVLNAIVNDYKFKAHQTKAVGCLITPSK